MVGLAYTALAAAIDTLQGVDWRPGRVPRWTQIFSMAAKPGEWRKPGAREEECWRLIAPAVMASFPDVENAGTALHLGEQESRML